MSEPVPFTHKEVIALSRSAVEKINRHGMRGTTLVTSREIEAMAVRLLMTGGLLHDPAPNDGMTRADRCGSPAQAIQPNEKDKSE